MGCRPQVPIPPGTGAGSRLSQQLRERDCPSKLAFSPEQPSISKFRGGPCKLSSPYEKCLSTCVPSLAGVAEAAAPSGFWDRCDDPSVLCVGDRFATRTLQQAVEAVSSSNVIVRILLASGVYVGGVSFVGLKRSLTIEGESIDPKSEVRIEAPDWTAGALPQDAAALAFTNTVGVVLRRLVVTGGRHGIVIDTSQQVGLDSVIVRRNTGNGVRIHKTPQVDISRSQFSFNGMPKDGVPTAQAPCRYGLVLEDVVDANVGTSLFASNGAGGLRSGPAGWLASTAPCAAVHADAAAQVAVNAKASLTLADNLFERNGPVGWQEKGQTGACEKPCGEGQFCEAGRCLPLLRQPADPRQPEGAFALLGVGAAIAGNGSVTLRGNGFSANDTTGLLVHSVVQLNLIENTISLNGLRSGAQEADMTRFASPALHLWHIQREVSLLYNLIIDNAATGLRISSAIAQPTQELINVQFNHISGNGRFIHQRTPEGGSGLVVDSSRKSGLSQLAVNENYLTANGTSGIWLSGNLIGELTGNYLETQLGRGIVLLGIGADKRAVLDVRRNTVKGAYGVGILARGGMARLLFDANLVRDIARTKDGQEGDPADGIQIIDLAGDPAILTNHLITLRKSVTITDVARAGLLIHNSKASLKDNGIEIDTPGHSIVSQGGATITGASADELYEPTTPLRLEDAP